MSEISRRYRKVAGDFTRRVEQVPEGAWDDPAPCDTPAGHFSVENAIATLCLGDILVHTWDLARATGLDETLDPDEVHGMYVGILSMDEVLRQSGHYGPRVEVPDDADEQTKLIAFTGRCP